MKRVLSTVQRRRLNLIEYMYSANHPVKLESMSKILNCSERIIKSDLNSIEESFSFLSFEYSNSKIWMSIENNYSLDEIYKLTFKSNLSFKFLSNLFFKDSATAETLSYLTYSSPPTIHRTKKKLDAILLDHFNISISTNPYSLSGPEDNIRIFYAQLFSDCYSIGEWPFDFVEESLLERFILFFTGFFNIYMNYSRLSYMKTVLAVNLNRLKQGHFCEVENEESYFIYEQIISTESFKESIYLYEKGLGIELTRENIEQLFYLFARKLYLFSYKELLIKSKSDDFIKNSLLQAENMLVSLSNKFSLSIPSKESLILDLHNILFLNRLDLDSIGIIYEQKKEFSESIKRQFPDFYEEALIHLEKLVVDLGYNWDRTTSYHLLFVLFTHWESLISQLIEKQTTINAIIVCKHDPYHAIFIKNILSSYLNSRIKFSCYSDTTFSRESLATSKYDLIISTFHIEKLEGKEIVCVDTMPSEKNIEAIRTSIDNIYDKKNSSLV